MMHTLPVWLKPEHRSTRGEVWLVGAGPGDPDLLTLRALKLIRAADVLLYDRLVTAQVVAEARPDARRIFVGKARGNHSLPQEQLNELLVHLARQGLKVCRLKGGDPFVFGRGGEELEVLVREGIPFQVVPGITAATGCAAFGGIPLTHRDHAQAVTFVTGHGKDGEVELDWAALTRPRQTVVFYMGLHFLGRIAGQLQAHGAPKDLPVALVENGTIEKQRVITGTLEELAMLARCHRVKAPAVVIVGEVVRLHEQLAWFGVGETGGVAMRQAVG